tara:strand:+ start:9399 stop:9677 length:279 start_codon:yes stop_codon:yes gene_type:complete
MTQDEIQKFVDEEINPALESHNGHLRILEFDNEERVLIVQMGGGCQGCSASKDTLYGQIEYFLKEQFPEIASIIDATDHASGKNPYYANKKK